MANNWKSTFQFEHTPALPRQYAAAILCGDWNLIITTDPAACPTTVFFPFCSSSFLIEIAPPPASAYQVLRFQAWATIPNYVFCPMAVSVGCPHSLLSSLVPYMVPTWNRLQLLFIWLVFSPKPASPFLLAHSHTHPSITNLYKSLLDLKLLSKNTKLRYTKSQIGISILTLSPEYSTAHMLFHSAAWNMNEINMWFTDFPVITPSYNWIFQVLL